MRTSLIAVAAAVLLAAAFPAKLAATTITFDDLGVGTGSQLRPPAGVGVVSVGFNYTPGPNNASHFTISSWITAGLAPGTGPPEQVPTTTAY